MPAQLDEEGGIAGHERQRQHGVDDMVEARQVGQLVGDTGGNQYDIEAGQQGRQDARAVQLVGVATKAGMDEIFDHPTGAGF